MVRLDILIGDLVGSLCVVFGMYVSKTLVPVFFVLYVSRIIIFHNNINFLRQVHSLEYFPIVITTGKTTL
jgi:hypothetical protein